MFSFSALLSGNISGTDYFQQLDGGSGSEDAGALELVVAQQRNALAEAKVLTRSRD